MGWVTGIVVFFLIWWTALFAVLPWGLQRDIDGKPQNAQIRRKFIITTVVSIAIWLVIYILIDMDIIDFRDIAGQMVREDYQ